MICKYGMKLDAIKHPVLVEEARYEVMAEELNDPQKIVNMFNDSVQLSDKAEEYLYMIALDSKCNALGIKRLPMALLRSALWELGKFYKEP